MAADVTIPRLGWAMEEGVFAGWLKEPGAVVVPGEPLFMLEGEKATQEVEAVDGGVLHLAPDAPSAGETVLVGRVIAALCAPGESPTWRAAPAAAAGPEAGGPAHASEPARPAAARAAVAAATPVRPPRAATNPDAIPRAASPSVRRLARHMGIDLSTVTPHLPGGRLSIEDVAGAAGAGRGPAQPIGREEGGVTRSSPRARRAAHARGLDITRIRGTGVGGRVRERDVLAASARAGAVTPAVEHQPISQTRRTIARQMVRSRQETVPVTLTAWADATAILAARAAGKAAHGTEAPTLNDILLVLLARTLGSHPLLAARWAETHLVLPGPRIDIGLAVDTAGGLVVPVVRDVAAASLAEVARQTRTLIDRARAGRLSAADMQGGVFTLTTLGSYGVEFFTPVINYPEAAILGVGAIRLQPVPAAGRDGFTLQRQLPLSLTFDHRIVDGAPAARFLGDLVTTIAAHESTAGDPSRSDSGERRP